MALLTVQEVTPAGITPSYAAAAGGGDTFEPLRGQAYNLHVKNGGGSSVTVTVDDPTSVGPTGAAAFNPDLAVSVPAGQERMILIDANRHQDPADDLVDITYSGVTSVTVAVFLARRS